MLISRHFDYDPLTATRRIMHFDPETERGIMEAQQDVTGIVELNKAEFNATDERTRYTDMTRVARIPMGILMELHRKGIAQDQERFAKWLDDPDNKVFRTRPGRMSR